MESNNKSVTFEYKSILICNYKKKVMENLQKNTGENVVKNNGKNVVKSDKKDEIVSINEKVLTLNVDELIKIQKDEFKGVQEFLEFLKTPEQAIKFFEAKTEILQKINNLKKYADNFQNIINNFKKGQDFFDNSNYIKIKIVTNIQNLEVENSELIFGIITFLLSKIDEKLTKLNNELLKY